MMRMTRTWDSTLSMIPKGGDTIWGGLDWSPEGYFNCSAKKLKNNDTQTADQNRNGRVNYGRIISFGKDFAEIPSYENEIVDFRVMF